MGVAENAPNDAHAHDLGDTGSRFRLRLGDRLWLRFLLFLFLGSIFVVVVARLVVVIGGFLLVGRLGFLIAFFFLFVVVAFLFVFGLFFFLGGRAFRRVEVVAHFLAIQYSPTHVRYLRRGYLDFHPLRYETGWPDARYSSRTGWPG